MAVLVGVALVAHTSPAAAQRQLRWQRVAIRATLAADGRLSIVERQSIIFTGDWNGGERRWNLRPRQHVDLVAMRRIDADGTSTRCSRATCHASTGTT